MIFVQILITIYTISVKRDSDVEFECTLLLVFITRIE